MKTDIATLVLLGALALQVQGLSGATGTQAAAVGFLAGLFASAGYFKAYFRKD